MTAERDRRDLSTYTTKRPPVGKRQQCGFCGGSGTRNEWKDSEKLQLLCDYCDGYGYIILTAVQEQAYTLSDGKTVDRIVVMPCLIKPPPTKWGEPPPTVPSNDPVPDPV